MPWTMTERIEYSRRFIAGRERELVGTVHEIALFEASPEAWEREFGKPFPGRAYARVMHTQERVLIRELASERAHVARLEAESA